MRLKSVTRCTQIVLLAMSAAGAQQAGPPTELKPPTDPTSQTRPSTTPATQPAAPATTPAPAPVVDSTESAKPADPSSDANNRNIPTTTIYPQTDAKAVLVPKLDPGPLPENKSALIGGKVKEIDQIRNQMTVEIFGKGGKMKVLFDPRTRFDRNGVVTDQTTIKKGDQVYLDTQLVKHKIFARDVYVHNTVGTADASGQVASYNPKTGELTINDQMSQAPVTVRLMPNTVIRNRSAAGSPSDLRRFALVSVKLSPADKGYNVANEIDVIAQPGTQFTFYGTLTHIDLRTGILAVDNKSDHKSYDIRFEPSQINVTNDLKVGSEVAVNATFNGRDYTARTLTVTPASHTANPE